ncbi:SpoIIE family protein phosphatase [Streptomyces netropsis]|uniref:Serine phosphatase RsbU (Regulator of sigma subunit) n=1 Tax=Streptomyces netropsis TaxID=55404 RepID=A0A7W7LCF4_STRNE|nr:SpoIIE family protein phosphatase [Streptomyces netropsis]MBB4887422.1 serine phosphatase RsbU (regulator of sigma subunit) [Streptomyces netropsis]GGR10205.1 transcription antitermination regulator [Streptomyces netropsis]
MTSEPVKDEESGVAPDVVALAKVVAALRAENERLHHQASTAAVLERAKGLLMARSGCSAAEAHEELTRRARAGSRTLTEECWIALGDIPQAAHPPFLPAQSVTHVPDVSDQDSPGPSRSTRHVPAPAASRAGQVPESGTEPRTPSPTALLGNLSSALTGATCPQDVAEQLLDHLAGPPVRADAVLLFSRTVHDALELAGHAGIGAAVAAQWRSVPPVGGIAALDTVRRGEAVWLEDPEQDAQRYHLIGQPPQKWHTRAWLPVTTGGRVTAALGVLRTVDAPFGEDVRELLQSVARLCAGSLRAGDAHPGPLRLNGRPGPSRWSGRPGTPKASGWCAPAGQPAQPDCPGGPEAGTAALVQAVFDVLPGPAILLTPLRSPAGDVEDFRIDAAAPQSVDVAGRRGRRLVGLRVLECYPTVAGADVWRGYLRTLTTGTPYEGEPFTYEEVVAGLRQRSVYSVRAVKLGDALVVTWTGHDDAARQQALLADLQRLGNLGWTDWNLVTGAITWSPQVHAILDREPGSGPLPLDAFPGDVLPEDAPDFTRALQKLLGPGTPVDHLVRITTRGGVRHLRVVAEAVPDAHGTPVEVHGFVQDVTAQRTAELALTESRQAVLAQRNVLQAERTVAARLQHALLPLPGQSLNLGDLRVDVAYLPSHDDLNVGGDWYSALEMPGGGILFAVGDVAGHGIDAVATMAQLRFTAKGMVVTGSSLTGALHRLNTLLLHTRDHHATATLVLGRYDPADRCLTWVQAGHPPPLLVRHGKAEFLSPPEGILLGATLRPFFGEAVCRIAPGDHLLLYTDGLVERPGEHLDEGLDRLARAAETELSADGPGSLDTLLSRLLPDEQRDDVCLLDIHLPASSA